MRLWQSCFLLFALAFLNAASAGKRYDERGNVITESGKTDEVTQVQQPANSAAAGAAAENPPEKNEAAGVAVAPPPGETVADEPEQQQANPLTRVYLENAQLYLRSERTDKALEMLRKAQEAGEDSYAAEARLTSLYLRARRGDAGLLAEAESLDEKQRATALLRIADGYYTCNRENSKKTECLNDAEKTYALLSGLSPASTEGKLAAIRLATLLLDQGRNEAALPHLTRVLALEKAGKNSGRAVPFDRAWFALGKVYESPWYNRDTRKARLAYEQVLRYNESPYRRAAKERIEWLERFATGYPRP